MTVYSLNKSSLSHSETTNIDKRQVVDNGAIGITADHSTISMLDAGAIERAFGFAEKTSTQNAETFEKLMGFAEKAMSMTDDSAKVAELAADKVAAAYEGASGQKIILYGVLIVAGLWLLQRKGRAA